MGGVITSRLEMGGFIFRRLFAVPEITGLGVEIPSHLLAVLKGSLRMGGVITPKLGM